jgi:futalosine hydrolase
MFEVKKLHKMTTYHLLVAATSMEVSHILEKGQSKSDTNLTYFKISDNIDCIITGIGQYNTVKAITQHISLYGKPTSIINIGIAGTYDTSIQLKSIYKVDKDIAFDQKVITTGNIRSWQEANLPNAQTNIFNPIPPEYENHIALAKVTGLTSDTISDSPERVTQIKEKYNSTLETMEGAACFYVANEYEIPCMQIRAVSNYVGESDKSLWKIEESIEELNRFVNENVIQLLDKR